MGKHRAPAARPPSLVPAGALALLGLVASGCGPGGDAGDAKSVAAQPAVPESAPDPGAAEAPPGDAAEVTGASGDPHGGPRIDHTVLDIAGEPVDLADYRGRALLIVNTASACGYTPQYAALQRVYGKYRDRGLVVLGFPSNDYGGQEPGTNEEISSFVDEKFGVEFPMMDKIHTRGPDIAPLYAALTQATPEGIRGEVKWNFTKFLVNPQGEVVGRFDTPVDPEGPEMIAAIEAVLPADPPATAE